MAHSILRPPLFPPYRPTPLQYNPQAVKRVVLPKRTTSATPGTDDTFPVPIPANAIALIGWSIGPVTTVPTNYYITSVQIGDLAGANQTTATVFMGARGTKTAWGCVPVDPSTQLLQGDLNAADASISYNPSAYFLVAQPGTLVSPVAFVPTGGPEQLVDVQQVSSANASQTLAIPNIVDQRLGCEILNAWFYNSGAGTSTGTMQYYDGTTAVTVDSTAAVANYAFNMGKVGSRVLHFQTAFGFTPQIQFTIGAGGVGVTTTLYVTYRVYPIR